MESTMRIAFANAGRVDTHLIVKDYTFEQFGLRLSTPKVGKKDGSYYIRGGDLIAPTRADENLRTAEIAIIDGDSSFDPESGEIVPGAPPFDDAIAALDDIGVSYIIHTSYSARPADGFWKYRIILPIQTHSVEELQAVVAHMLEQLHARGVYIADVRENGVWSQPWYLPRVASADDLPAFRSHTFDGRALEGDEVEAIAAAHKKRKAKDEVLASTPPVSKSLREADSPIRQFNEQHGLDWIRSALSSQGYKFGYVDRDRSYRYMRPGSESKTFGLKVFQGKFGDWCTYSHHGAADPLSGKVFDAFAVFATFQHSGDLKAAARSLHHERKVAEAMAQYAPQQAADLPDAPDEGHAPDERFITPEMQQAKPEAKPATIVASQFILIPGPQIPPRDWLYGRQLIRKFASATISPGGIGKSSLTIVEALAMVTGRKLLHDEPKGKSRVWLWNGEDPRDELQRRIAAACQHYGIANDELDGRLFVDTGREQELIIARRVDRDVIVVEPIVDAIIANARKFKIDCMIVDPFVSSHRVSENANEEVDRVSKTWNRIADATNCAIQLVHHSRKTPNEVTVDDARGASALRDSVRSARALNGMTDDEAAKYSLQDRWRYFRATNGKANLAPRSDDSMWFKMESVPLNNGDATHEGDVVGVVTAFTIPGAFDAVTGDKAVEILMVIDRGLEDGRRFGWGKGVTEASDRNPVPIVAERAGVEDEVARRMVGAWIKVGVLVVKDYDDPVRRKPVKGLFWNRKKTGDA
jgi:RecA-family ATPase